MLVLETTDEEVKDEVDPKEDAKVLEVSRRLFKCTKCSFSSASSLAVLGHLCQKVE